MACGFIDNGDALLRIIDSRVVSPEQVSPIPLLQANNTLQITISRYQADRDSGKDCKDLVFGLEKAQWPLKIASSDIPCYIVPIRAEYAVQLFDENLANDHMSLFSNTKTEPALSIENGINESALVIADLSYGNKNVHHEIGYAQGLKKKVLMLYKTRSGVEPKTEIGSNISMHDQLRYSNQTELRPKLLKKIRQFFGVCPDD